MGDSSYNKINFYCQNCGNELPAGSCFCNKCGTKIQSKNESLSQKRNFGATLKNIFTRISDFIVNFCEALSNIPVIGCLIPIILIILALLLAGLIVYAIIMLIVWLFSLHIMIGFTVFLGGMDVIAYFASYKWGMRKPWFFWLCLLASIAAPLLPLFLD